MVRKSQTLQRRSLSRAHTASWFSEENLAGSVAFDEDQMLRMREVIMVHLKHDLGFDDAKSDILVRDLTQRIRPTPSTDNRNRWANYTSIANEENGLVIIYLSGTALKDMSVTVHEVDHALAVMKDAEGHTYLDPEEDWAPTAWGLLNNNQRIGSTGAFIDEIGKKELLVLERIVTVKAELELAQERFYLNEISADDYLNQKRELDCLRMLILWREFIRFYELGLEMGGNQCVTINSNEIRIDCLEAALRLAKFLTFEKHENYKIGYFVAGFVEGASSDEERLDRLQQLRAMTLAGNHAHANHMYERTHH